MARRRGGGPPPCPRQPRGGQPQPRGHAPSKRVPAARPGRASWSRAIYHGRARVAARRTRRSRSATCCSPSGQRGARRAARARRGAQRRSTQGAAERDHDAPRRRHPTPPRAGRRSPSSAFWRRHGVTSHAGEPRRRRVRRPARATRSQYRPTPLMAVGEATAIARAASRPRRLAPRAQQPHLRADLRRHRARACCSAACLRAPRRRRVPCSSASPAARCWSPSCSSRSGASGRWSGTCPSRPTSCCASSASCCSCACVGLRRRDVFVDRARPAAACTGWRGARDHRGAARAGAALVARRFWGELRDHSAASSPAA